MEKNTYSVYDCRKGYTGVWEDIEVFDLDNLCDHLYHKIREEEYVWDCDICGWESYYFVIRGPLIEGDKYFKVHHNWYPLWGMLQDSEVETDEDGYVETNYFYIDFPESIPKKYPEKTRDWLKLSSYSGNYSSLVRNKR